MWSVLDHADLKKSKKQITATSKDIWKTCTIPEKNVNLPRFRREGGIVVGMQLHKPQKKKKPTTIKAPIVNSLLME